MLANKDSWGRRSPIGLYMYKCSFGQLGDCDVTVRHISYLTHSILGLKEA